MRPHAFGEASQDERIVFGARRPGYPNERVDERCVADWIGFMQDNEIRRVMCLLEKGQLDYYSSLPNGLLCASLPSQNPGSTLRRQLRTLAASKTC